MDAEDPAAQHGFKKFATNERGCRARSEDASELRCRTRWGALCGVWVREGTSRGRLHEHCERNA